MCEGPFSYWNRGDFLKIFFRLPERCVNALIYFLKKYKIVLDKL